MGHPVTQPHYAPYLPPQVIAHAPSKAVPITAVVIGAVLLVIAPVLGLLIGSFAMIPPALDTAAQVVSASPSGTVELRRGASVYLMAPESATPAIEPAECVATAEDGTRLPVDAAPAGAWGTRFGDDYFRSFAKVTAAEAGIVTITCADARSPVMTAPAFSPEVLLRPFAWWAIGGLVAGVIGLVLTIVGIVGLVRKPQPRAA